MRNVPNTCPKPNHISSNTRGTFVLRVAKCHWSSLLDPQNLIMILGQWWSSASHYLLASKCLCVLYEAHTKGSTKADGRVLSWTTSKKVLWSYILLTCHRGWEAILKPSHIWYILLAWTRVCPCLSLAIHHWMEHTFVVSLEVILGMTRWNNGC